MVNSWTRGALCAVVVAVTVAGVGMARPAAAHPPPFFWMGDLSADESRFGFEVAVGQVSIVTLLDDILVDDSATVVAAALAGQLALTDQVAVIGRFPFAHVRGPDGLFDDTSVILGNAAVGLQYVPVDSRSSGDLSLGFGLVASLPTASDGLVEGRAASAASILYLPDVARFFPDVTGVRARGDLRVEGRTLFLQAELAYDRLIADGPDLDLLLGAVGLGVTLSPYYALLGELTTVSRILDDEDDDFAHALDLGVRYHDPRMMAGLRLHLPVDDELEGFGVFADIGGRF